MARKKATFLAAVGLVSLALGPTPAAAIPRLPAPVVSAQGEGPAIEKIRAGRRHAVARPLPAYRPARPAYRPGYRPRRPAHLPAYRPGYRPVYRPPVVGGWRRPATYWWAPGAAIAAGAAVGFVTAAAAARYAGTAPGPNYCWYYTDPGRTRGFWDVCP
jgi:hypothetical protein